MTWLISRGDYDAWAAKTGQVEEIIGQARHIGVVEIAHSWIVKQGHIVDTDYPELGMPTFAEFGHRYAKLMGDRLKEFGDRLKEFQEAAKKAGLPTKGERANADRDDHV